MSGITGEASWGGTANGRPSLRAYTLHVDFLAVDEQHARYQAATYAEGLTQFRPEVDGYTAGLSPADRWSATTSVFCRASGPSDTDVCVDSAGHGGDHYDPAVGGRWGDGGAGQG